MNFDLGGSRRKGAKLCNQGHYSSSLMIAMLCLSLVFGLCVGMIRLNYVAWDLQQKNILFRARLYTPVMWSDFCSSVAQVEESPNMQANRELQDGAWRCVSTKQLRTSPKRDTSSHPFTWEPQLAWGFCSKSVCMPVCVFAFWYYSASLLFFHIQCVNVTLCTFSTWKIIVSKSFSRLIDL